MELAQLVLYGTIINGITIIVGGFLGLFFSNIEEKYKETVIHGVSLVVILIGLQMALTADQVILVLVSLLIGALIGEKINIEDNINKFARKLTSRLKTKNNDNIAQAFITATLIFAIGAMAIIGALDSGVRGDHEILITKAIIDGFTALILTTTLGYGVIFSAIPVVLYQGSIAILATQIEKIVPDHLLQGLITQITAVGGLLIVAIGLNLLKVTHIRISNLLPALLIVCIAFFVYELFI